MENEITYSLPAGLGAIVEVGGKTYVHVGNDWWVSISGSEMRRRDTLEKLLMAVPVAEAAKTLSEGVVSDVSPSTSGKAYMIERTPDEFEDIHNVEMVIFGLGTLEFYNAKGDLMLAYAPGQWLSVVPE